LPRINLPIATLDELKTQLQSDMHTAISAARKAADLEDREVAEEELVVTFYDKFYKPIAECGNYIELLCNFPRNDVGSGKITLPKYSNANTREIDPLAAAAVTCWNNTVPVTIEVGHLLWSGRVKIAHDNFNGTDKSDYIECELEGDYAWLMKIMAWPDYLLPLQVQFPPRGVAIGPAVSCLKWLLVTQAWRIQSGLWDLVNNLLSLNLDWRTWFGTAFENGPGQNDLFAALRTPIYVVPTNAWEDTSPFISINWRMDKVGTIFKQQLIDLGLEVQVRLWRPGDPQPTDNDPLLDLYPLTVPTIVFDIKDYSGITGPTGTWVDGVLRDLVDLEGSVLGDVLSPFLNPNNEYDPTYLGINIAPALGVNFVAPWVIFNADAPQSGIYGKISYHHPESWRVIVGGKSPQWMNDLINATMSYVLDMVMIVVGITGVPSNLFDGLFNDILLAFQLADNFERRVAVGPYGYPEVFVPTNDAAYNIDGIFALIREMWNTRGYPAGQVQFLNGRPYEIGRDIFTGQLASIVRDGFMYTDYVENVTIRANRQTATEVLVQIGDGKQQQAPVVRIQRRLAAFEAAFNALTLSPNAT
jgi:hypothetical protein